MTKKILLIEGDGIGPEVVSQAKKVIDFFSKNTDKKLENLQSLKNKFNNQSLYTDLKIQDFNLVSELFKPLNSLVINPGTYFNININNQGSNNYIQLKSPTLKYKAFVFKNINLNIEPDFKSNFKT